MADGIRFGGGDASGGNASKRDASSGESGADRGVDKGDCVELMKDRSDKDTEPNLEEARLRQQAIGVKLRQMFDDIVNEPVPDEFLDILRKADQRSSSGGSSSGAGGGRE